MFPTDTVTVDLGRFGVRELRFTLRSNRNLKRVLGKSLATYAQEAREQALADVLAEVAGHQNPLSLAQQQAIEAGAVEQIMKDLLMDYAPELCYEALVDKEGVTLEDIQGLPLGDLSRIVEAVGAAFAASYSRKNDPASQAS